MKKSLTLLLCLYSIGSITNTAISLALLGTSPAPAFAKQADSASTIARQITVKVYAGDRRGSGTLIAKRGQKYTVLTNAHVANKSNTYRIVTSDGRTHTAKCAQPLTQGTCGSKDRDLALLEFTAPQSYAIPQWGDSDRLQPGEQMYSAGFPFEQQQLKIDRSTLSMLSAKPLQGGYRIGFGISTAQGMSGGPLLNSSGQLLGIIGFGSEPILNNGYQYQDGSRPEAAVIKQLRKSSFAIPIATLAQINSQYQAFLPKSSAESRPSTPTTVTKKTNYTGVVKRVDDIAQQITVRIENSQGKNGSGVIIARQGNTYYVATAAHVVNGQGYSIITPTQERVTAQQIIIPEKETDVAIVKFQSSQNYQLAKIGKDPSRAGVRIRLFVSGFPGKDASKQRYLSIGNLANIDKNFNELAVKERENLTSGYEMLYTNLSLPGMSGGAVLDSQGRLVGIAGRADNDSDISEQGEQVEITTGLAIGVPIATVRRVLKPQLPSWQEDLVLTPTLTTLEEAEISHIQLAALAMPSQKSSARDWLDYGSLLWRSGKSDESIVAFVRAAKLLKDNATPNRQQLGLAYYGLAIVLGGGKQTKLALSALEQATKISPDSAPAWRYLAVVLSSLDRKAEAVSAFQQAIAIQSTLKKPPSASLYLLQGYTLVELNRYSEAMPLLDRGIAIVPNNPYGYLARGVIYRDQKQYSQALADFNKAIQLDPQLALAYYNRGLTYSNQKQYPQALVEYSKAIQLDPQKEQSYLARGNVYLDQKQYPQALADYNKAIQINPQYAFAYYNRGLVYGNQERYPQALVEYSKAIQLDPTDASAYRNRGIIYAIQEQYPQALADSNKAIQLDPQNATVYNNRGNVYRNQERYPQAVADYSKAIQLDPQNVSAYIDRGTTYAAQKQYSQALADYNKAIQLDPKSVKAYTYRGGMYREQKQYPQALVDFNKAIQLDPQNMDVYIYRGDTYFKQDRYPQALADFSKAIQVDPKSVKAYNTRGNFYAMQKQYPQAIADFSKAIQLEPQNAEIYSLRGLAYFIQKQYPQALADYSKAIQINPQNVDAYNSRGDIYSIQKQYPQALADYSKVIQINPQNAATYNSRGYIYANQKQYPQALADYSKAIQINPQNAATYNSRGYIYANQKQYPQALADYSKVIQINPQNVDAYNNRGLAYSIQKQYPQALADYSKVIQINPQNVDAYNNQRRLCLLYPKTISPGTSRLQQSHSN